MANEDTVWSNKQKLFFKLPSLKHLCLVKIGTLVLNDPLYTIQVDQLPSTLKSDLSDCIDYMIGEVNDWNAYILNTKSTFADIVWTQNGRVDKISTATEMMKSFDETQKFRLACRFCLQDPIMSTYTVFVNTTESFEGWNDVFLCNYWATCCQIGAEYEENYYTLTWQAIENCHDLAVKYFWHYLNPIEKDEIMNLYLNPVPNGQYINSRDILLFFISKMTDVQLKFLFKYHYRSAYVLLLNSPSYRDYEILLSALYKNDYIDIAGCMKIVGCFIHDFYDAEDEFKRREHLFFKVLRTLFHDMKLAYDTISELNVKALFEVMSELFTLFMEFIAPKENVLHVIIKSDCVKHIMNIFGTESLQTLYERALQNNTPEANNAFMKSFIDTECQYIFSDYD